MIDSIKRGRRVQQRKPRCPYVEQVSQLTGILSRIIVVGIQYSVRTPSFHSNMRQKYSLKRNDRQVVDGSIAFLVAFSILCAKMVCIQINTTTEVQCQCRFGRIRRAKKKPDMISEIINNLRRVFQVVNEQSKKVERQTGLTGPQLWAIKTIAQEAPIMVNRK